MRNEEEFESFKELIYYLFFYKQNTIAILKTSLNRLEIKEFEIPNLDIEKEFEEKLKKGSISPSFISVKDIIKKTDKVKVTGIKVRQGIEILFLKRGGEVTFLDELSIDSSFQEGRVLIYKENISKDTLLVNYNNYKFLVDNSLLFSQTISPTTLGSILKKMEKYLSPEVYLNLKKVISPFFSGEIKSIYPSLSDIYIATKNEKIPFSLVGDGIKNLTLNYFALNLDKPTYLFLEEPETFLHPKMMKILAEEIIRSGKRNQIFLTTHSLEFVEYLLYHAKKIEDVNVKVLGFYDLIDGKLDYEIYNHKEAYSIVNKLGEDIR
jgi:AAA15 family ATPase/GTPase